MGRNNLTLLEEGLIKHEAMQTEMKFHNPLTKVKLASFASLYVTQKETRTKEKVIKTDRNILQHLIMAYESGRQMIFQQILWHQLMPVPLALAETNHSLRSEDKSILIDI